MKEETVSASHFRVHFNQIAKGVAQGGQACTVERHGLATVVVVSLEDAEFLRQHKWGKGWRSLAYRSIVGRTGKPREVKQPRN